MRLLLPILLLFVSVGSTACAPQKMSTEHLVSSIRQRLEVGVARTEVERRLSAFPEVHYVYVPGNKIMPADERVLNGVELSGRITISTSLEIRGLSKAVGVIRVDFDRDDRVIAIREDGFGY
jgi:hypothetical protein